MRPVAAPSSWLHQPLDELLGTRAAVRVLRVLTLYGDVMPATTVAARARLTRPSARQTLDRLVRLGVVDREGRGRSVVYRIRRGGALSSALDSLFRDEARRGNTLIQRVRRTAGGLRPAPAAVWLFGSAARNEDAAGSDIDLAVVAGPGTVNRVAGALRAALVSIENELGVATSVMPVTLSKLRRLARDDHPLWQSLRRDAVPLVGPAPEELIGG